MAALRKKRRASCSSFSWRISSILRANSRSCSAFSRRSQVCHTHIHTHTHTPAELFMKTALSGPHSLYGDRLLSVLGGEAGSASVWVDACLPACLPSCTDHHLYLGAHSIPGHLCVCLLLFLFLIFFMSELRMPLKGAGD